MRFGTAVTIGAVALLQKQQQQRTGVVGAAAVGTEPGPSLATAPTGRFSPLIASSKRRLQGHQNLPHRQHRHLENTDTFDDHHGILSDEDNTTTGEACDVTAATCLGNEKCAACFRNMSTNNIDWATLASGTDCDAVIAPIVEKNICDADLAADEEAKTVFCTVIDSCAVADWNDDGGDYGDDAVDDESEDGDGARIDCDGLTSCDFPGIKVGLIGDGACHDFINGCYNTAICGYDGGDCCEDKCEQKKDNLVDCGSDGYLCRDPTSDTCETTQCVEARNSTEPDGKKEGKGKRCEEGETGFVLYKYASFGNGWDKTSMTIDTKGSRKKGQLYKGTMTEGAMAQDTICLSSEPACYDVQLGGGTWGNRVSWQIKPMMKGAPEIASGGAPLQCQFPVGGEECDNTCKGQSDPEPHKDDTEHNTYEQMEKCIESTCLIQLGTCEDSETCNTCMSSEDAPAYCYSDSNFNALVKCTLCNCVPEASDAEGFETYCETMDKDSGVPEETGKMPECSSEQVLSGITAVLNYSDCSDVGFEAAVTTKFDNDHFGRLDAFESCATTYTTEPFHGGKTALDCMRILQLAVDSPTNQNIVEPTDPDPAEAISKMAAHLYNDGKNFCDCSALASEACPVCKDFKNFKTLMYESVDACRALDAIDCAAWAEFSTPCQENMQTKFGGATFSTDTQCDYVHDGCGNAGPFPSFRDINCKDEIDDTQAWDFYQDFASNCLKGKDPKKDSGGTVPNTDPVPQPAPKFDKRTPKPTVQYIPDAPDGTDSSEAVEKKTSRGGGFKKFLTFTFFCIVCGAGYWYYKRRTEFDYVRFRRARNYGFDSGGMYEGSAMENSASSFEPPSLPPPPSQFSENNNSFA